MDQPSSRGPRLCSAHVGCPHIAVSQCLRQSPTFPLYSLQNLVPWQQLVLVYKINCPAEMFLPKKKKKKVIIVRILPPKCKTLWYSNKMKRFHKIISQIIGFLLLKDPMLFLLSNVREKKKKK